jgi:deoxyuridine 5'-triphosphate nucleotidohydrolase
MTELRPLYLSVADDKAAFETLQIEQCGSLVKMVGPGVAFLTPQDARAAILHIQAILDMVSPPKSENEAPWRFNGVLPVKRLTKTATLPVRAKPGDAGMDLYADEDATVPAHGRRLVETGIAVAIPLGYVGLVWPRSGMATHDGVSTDAGVIDAGYRGPVKVLLTNATDDDYPVIAGHKIAQLVVQPVTLAKVEEVSELPNSARGAAGFGSTGA